MGVQIKLRGIKVNVKMTSLLTTL